MSDLLKSVYVVLHDVHAVSRVIETAQVVYGLGFSNFVVTKAEGSAAQTGVPEANRLAMKMEGSFMVLPDLHDVLDVLNVERPILIVSPVLAKNRLNIDDVVSRVRSKERLVVAFSGSNKSFSKKEMDMGDCFSLEAKVDIGSSGSAAVVLYAISTALS